MSAGDLVVGPTYPQYEFNGLLFGSTTRWIVSKFTGLLGSADLRTTDQERQGADGDFTGQNYYKSKRPAVDLIGYSDTGDIEDQIDLFRQTFIVSDIPMQLVYRRKSTKPKFFMWAIVEKTNLDSDSDSGHGLIRPTVQWKCADPLTYALVESSVTITDGIGVASNSATVTNGGTRPTAALINIVGPCVNPRLTNAQDASKQIKIDVTVASGHTLVIDIASETITMDGTVYPPRADNQWWKLVPGGNTITFSRTGTGASTAATVLYHDAWM